VPTDPPRAGCVTVENGAAADCIKYRGDCEVKTRAENELGQRDKETSRGEFAEMDKTEVEDAATDKNKSSTNSEEVWTMAYI
jgi:hypothetical protein